MTLLWTQKHNSGPSARTFPTMTFDAAREQVVLFGGEVESGAEVGDTWSWDGTDWIQLSDMGPSPRVAAAIAYDAAREQVVLVGGFGTDITSTETWAWDGVEWTQLADFVGPDVRAMHAMAFDPVRELLILFGGIDGEDNVLADTWAWSGDQWEQLADSGPKARFLHAMTFDAVNERVLLFGGVGPLPSAPGATPEAFSDTWHWDGARWTKPANFGPPAAQGASMDCDGRTVLLFGGGIATVSPLVAFGDTWQWDDRRWVERQNMGPKPRLAAGLAFDSTRRRYVLFGGAGAPPAGSTAGYTVLGDTWETFDPAATEPEPGAARAPAA
jgi:hypothetical protein